MKFCTLCVDLMQYYSHLVTCVVVGPNVILSLVVLDPARQEVFL
jgi:hypothetical protein